MSGPKGETAIVKRCMDALAVRCPGATYWRQNAGMKGYVKFTSRKLVDIIGFQKFGQFLAVEVKDAEGELLEHQYDFLRDVFKAGGLAMVYAPVTQHLDKFYDWENVPAKFIPTTRRAA